MALTDVFRAGWRRLFFTPQLNDRQRIIEILCRHYLDETKDVYLFTEHAQRMVYPHLRERFLRIVEEEQAHVTWLANQIRTFGGAVPQPVVPVTSPKSLWEYLRMDEDEEKRDAANLVQQINALEHDYPEVAEGLRRIRATEHRHRAELLDLAMKTNPNGLPVVVSDQDALKHQKHAWLEQQKMAWFDARRAEWESGGRQTRWAEWIAERELQWRVNELPNRELQWRKHLAEQGLEGASGL